eukprot:7388062-Prymnesium_polylepis.3
MPSANELEFHPWVDEGQAELVRYCKERGIHVIAYNSLGKHDDRTRTGGAGIGCNQPQQDAGAGLTPICGGLRHHGNPLQPLPEPHLAKLAVGRLYTHRPRPQRNRQASAPTTLAAIRHQRPRLYPRAWARLRLSRSAAHETSECTEGGACRERADTCAIDAFMARSRALSTAVVAQTWPLHPAFTNALCGASPPFTRGQREPLPDRVEHGEDESFSSR